MATAKLEASQAGRQAGQKCDVRRRRRYLALLTLLPLLAARRPPSAVALAMAAPSPARAADPEAPPVGCRAGRRGPGHAGCSAGRWRGVKSSQAGEFASDAAQQVRFEFGARTATARPSNPLVGRDRRRRAACDRSRLVVLFALGMKSTHKAACAWPRAMPLQKRGRRRVASRPSLSASSASKPRDRRSRRVDGPWNPKCAFCFCLGFRLCYASGKASITQTSVEVK